MTTLTPVALGADNLVRLADLKALAMDALPADDMDYGTERQVAAETLFFKKCYELLPADFEEGSQFHNYCLKATTEEMIGEAVKILARRLGGEDSLPR